MATEVIETLLAVGKALLRLRTSLSNTRTARAASVRVSP